MTVVAPCRILGVDPSLRGTGFGVLDRAAGASRVVEFGVIKNPPALALSSCLLAIREGLGDVIRRTNPDCVAIESTIFVQSYRTAITLGAARGAALLAPAELGIPIYEYAPRRVKQAVVGRGAADKSQVGFMVRALLEMRETPPPDAADALAIALTHAQHLEAAGRRGTILQRV